MAQQNFEEILLPDWEDWDGNGVSYIPGKNVILKNGKAGCILLDSEGVGVYSVTIEELDMFDDMNDVFIDNAPTPAEKHRLETYLSKSDLEEAYIVYENYMKREQTIFPQNQD